ncbi:MAG TPA: IscS subfamily cysteine desulfurase [Ferruginibacter sp.]|nr:IscS subfamily cysteine desulfurase [Ferruginibacter sp.]HRO16964.1 IscS subfamily cysteine desulfurase [Ferruginibacter sp.]HRQ20743.1 IscS subfamily cysteine desulfurase [Ferruginibacter sp.]
MAEKPVYLDHNATTPVDPRVLEFMLPYFTEHFGNASSRSHPYGLEAAHAVEFAREQIASLIGAEAKEIIFTSGATESVNLAMKGVFETYASKGNHIILLETEHKAVMDTAATLEKNGAAVTILKPESNGMIQPDLLEAAIRPDTILIAAMYANNETGVIQPVQAISAIARKNGVLFFTDATQAVGKIPVQVEHDGIDLMAFSAHKMYGPKGVGALYVRRKQPRVKLTAQLDGGGHERGLRSGTLNVPGIVGFGKAAEICKQEMAADTKRLAKLRDKLEHAFLQMEEVQVNGDTNHRLPHVTNITFRYIEGDGLMLGFNQKVAVSSGSACSSALTEPSHVLIAMGLTADQAKSTLRFSLGRYTKEQEIDFAIKAISDTVMKLREISPLWEMYKEGMDLDQFNWPG